MSIALTMPNGCAGWKYKSRFQNGAIEFGRHYIDDLVGCSVWEPGAAAESGGGGAAFSKLAKLAAPPGKRGCSKLRPRKASC